MSRKFVACYKVFRGGEWFDASLESVREHTDGAVVVFSKHSWASGDLPENCSEPLRRFQLRHPDYPVVVRSGEFQRGCHQYDVALETIRQEFGEDAAVMVVDTDEVWEPEQVATLRKAVMDNPGHHYFRSRLFSYVRSPLYQVWPLENAQCCVALQHARPQTINVRFSTQSAGSSLQLPDICFHHFSYVRENPADIELKFRCTSLQETTQSKASWLTDVWPKIPRGENLHMTPGHEECWREIKVLHKSMIPLPWWCDDLKRAEALHWQSLLESESPHDTLIPIPTPHDAKKYPEFTEDAFLRGRLKMTYLESLVLGEYASTVQPGETIVEIGSGTGGSLAVMGLASPQSKLLAIDPFTPYDEATHAGVVHGVREGNEEAFWETMQRLGLRDRVRHIKENSDVAAPSVPDGVGMVLVDGNHSAPIASKDIQLYWPKLRPGGCMIVHDWATRFPGVIRAVEESGLDFHVAAGTSLAVLWKPE